MPNIDQNTWLYVTDSRQCEIWLQKDLVELQLLLTPYAEDDVRSSGKNATDQKRGLDFDIAVAKGAIQTAAHYILGVHLTNDSVIVRSGEGEILVMGQLSSGKELRDPIELDIGLLSRDHPQYPQLILEKVHARIRGTFNRANG